MVKYSAELSLVALKNIPIEFVYHPLLSEIFERICKFTLAGRVSDTWVDEGLKFAAEGRRLAVELKSLKQRIHQELKGQETALRKLVRLIKKEERLNAAAVNRTNCEEMYSRFKKWRFRHTLLLMVLRVINTQHSKDPTIPFPFWNCFVSFLHM